jgi:hypothetical protein
VPSFQLCDEYLGERRTLEECQSVSAADGSFEVHRDDPRSPPSRHGFKARLAIVSHGFALAVSSLGKAGEPWDLDQVVLSPEGPLTVRVVDPSGRPVAGARIEQGEAGISWDWVGDTDGAGLARAWPLDEPTRPTCFRAVHPLFPTTRVGECLYAGGKARAQLSIALPPACWVGGRVLKDGAPVASATVVDLKHEGLSAVTGADGRYRLGPLEEGAHAPALRRALPAKQEGAPVDGVEAAERIERASIDLRAGEEKTVDLQAQ